MDKLDFISITTFLLTMLAIFLHQYAGFTSYIFWDLFIIIGTNVAAFNLIAKAMYREWAENQ